MGFGKVLAMKITCNACGSNYAIADEKVSGRLVKVRCKSCGAAIVVDARVQAPAMAAGAAAPSTPAPDAQDPAAAGAPDVAADSWSVNLSENESRTMTLAEIVAAHRLGELADAYVWRDGMEDWAPLMAVPELATAVEAAQRAPSAPAAAPTRTAATSPLFGGPAATPATGNQGPTRAAATRPKQTPDLFGSAAQAGSEEDARQAPPPEEEHQRPVGARNENSVLFSLDALRAGVTAAAAPAAAAGHAAPRAPGRSELGARTPAVSDDPFGLGAAAPLPAFDPSANLALMNAPPPPEPKPEPRRPRVVEAAATDGVAPPGPSKRTLLFAVAGTAVVMLAIMGVVLVVVLGRGSGEEVAQATSASAPAAESAKPAAATAATDTATDTATSGAVAAATEPASDTATSTDTATAEPQKPLTAEEKRKLEEALALRRAEDAKKKAAADAAADAAKKKEAEKKEAAAVASGFDKGAASAALSSAASAATSCKRADGPTGTGRVLVTFAPSGRVTTANVTGGGFGGTSVGGCVASVFRSARVPPFEGSPVTVSKSFNIP